MKNTTIWFTISSEWYFGQGVAHDRAIFSLKLVRIPLIRTRFLLKSAYRYFDAYHSHCLTRLAHLGIFTRNLAL
jgi:hypothetical protein